MQTVAAGDSFQWTAAHGFAVLSVAATAGLPADAKGRPGDPASGLPNHCRWSRLQAESLRVLRLGRGLPMNHGYGACLRRPAETRSAANLRHPSGPPSQVNRPGPGHHLFCYRERRAGWQPKLGSTRGRGAASIPCRWPLRLPLRHGLPAADAPASRVCRTRGSPDCLLARRTGP